MTAQLSLLGVDVPSPRWLCSVDRKPCPRQGRAVYGDPVDLGGCVNVAVRCVTCGATGEESTRTDMEAR